MLEKKYTNTPHQWNLDDLIIEKNELDESILYSVSTLANAENTLIENAEKARTDIDIKLTRQGTMHIYLPDQSL